MSLSKEKVVEMHKEFNEAIGKLAKKHGFQFEGKRWTYDLDGVIRGKIKFVLSESVELIANKFADRFRLKVRMNDKVVLKGVDYKVVDITSRGKVVILDEAGKTWTVRRPEHLAAKK